MAFLLEKAMTSRETDRERRPGEWVVSNIRNAAAVRCNGLVRWRSSREAMPAVVVVSTFPEADWHWQENAACWASSCERAGTQKALCRDAPKSEYIWFFDCEVNCTKLSGPTGIRCAFHQTRVR